MTEAKNLSLKYKKYGEEYVNGPDQILPAETYFTSKRHGAVRIREYIPRKCEVENKSTKQNGTIGENGTAYQNGHTGKRETTMYTGSALNGSVPCPPRMSIPTMVTNSCNKYSGKTALAIKRNDEWVKWTYDNYYRDICSCAKGFIHLGLERLHTVAVLGINSPEWVIAEIAAAFAGGVGMGIYTTNSSDACVYALEDSKSNILIVEDDVQLQKILIHRNKLKHLKAIIQYTGEVQHEGVISWQQLIYLGETLTNVHLEDRLRKIAINQMCVLVYTSGTTGNPKGVMLSHDNLATSAFNISETINYKGNNAKYVSFLPLSHVAAKVFDIYGQILIGSAVYFADKDAFKGSLIKTMVEVRPTFFLAVPRVFEKIYDRIQGQINEMGYLRRLIFDWALTYGTDCAKRMEKGDNTQPYGYGLASKILNKIKIALGFDECSYITSGAASMSSEVLYFFASVNIPILEAYGMSESSGPHTGATAVDYRLEGSGRALPVTAMRIDKDGDGELSLWGRTVFMGYLNKPEFIESDTSEDGWLKTGDLATIDMDGYLFIKGRKKEILVTSGGENIPPIPIEDNIKIQLPCISHAVLIGDNMNFVSVLLTLKVEIDPDTNEPTDELLPSTRKWCERLGSCAKSVSDIINSKDSNVFSAIDEGIERVNAKASSNPQRIRKWFLLSRDFSILGGELGPTMKLKRDIVLKKYANEVKSLYCNANNT